MFSCLDIFRLRWSWVNVRFEIGACPEIGEWGQGVDGAWMSSYFIHIAMIVVFFAWGKKKDFHPLVSCWMCFYDNCNHWLIVGTDCTILSIPQSLYMRGIWWVCLNEGIDDPLKRAWHQSSSFQMENTPGSLFRPRYWLVNSIICGVCLAFCVCVLGLVNRRPEWWSSFSITSFDAEGRGKSGEAKG